MAIPKGDLEEFLLSKSELAAMRVLRRVSLLNEGLVVLQNYTKYLSGNTGFLAGAPTYTRITEFNDYLNKAIEFTLIQHRLPAVVPTSETKSPEGLPGK